VILGLYRILTSLAGPLIDVAIRRRAREGREDAARIAERYGRSDLPRPAGNVVWFHAASVGESMSVLPLIAALMARRPDCHPLLTTGTVSSAKLLIDRLPKGASHQFAPIDRIDCVRRFLDHWRPQAGIWVESELWPNLIVESQARGLPMALVNARLSERSYGRWRLLRGTIGTLLRSFRVVLAQTPLNAKRLVELGAPSARTIGNLKHAAPPLLADPAEVGALLGAIASRPRWLAASTHPGEEAIAGRMHRELAPRHKRLLTVIVPRHAERGPAIAAELRSLGFALARRGAGEPIGEQTEIYLADTMGELGLFYRAVPIVFVGGSLVPHGGQNPLEPARLGAAVLHGPHMTNFPDILAELQQAGACEEVGNEVALARSLDRLLEEPALLRARGAAGRRAAQERAEVVTAVLDAITPILPGEHARP
jgi:3-deoxy-D-manno-octulosonic-acid transferase